ncbi:MAG: TRAP transporter small permease subunit [Planctomycetota bacterium]
MKPLLALSRGIDRVNGIVGAFVFGAMLIVVLIGAINTLARKIGSEFGITLTSNALVELQWYLFATIFLLGAAYTLRENGHVRVDVVYDRLGPRVRSWIDLVGHLAFLIPFCLYAVWTSFGPEYRAEEGWQFIGPVADSWRTREGSPDPGGLPRYPIKTLVPIAFLILAAQGLSEVIKIIARLRGAAPAPVVSEATEAGHL